MAVEREMKNVKVDLSFSIVCLGTELESWKFELSAESRTPFMFTWRTAMGQGRLLVEFASWLRECHDKSLKGSNFVFCMSAVNLEKSPIPVNLFKALRAMAYSEFGVDPMVNADKEASGETAEEQANDLSGVPDD